MSEKKVKKDNQSKAGVLLPYGGGGPGVDWKKVNKKNKKKGK